MRYILTPVLIRPSDGALIDSGEAILCLPPSDVEPTLRISRMIELAEAATEHDGLIAQRDALAGACEALIKAHNRLLGPRGRMMDFADDMARVCGMAGDALAMAGEVRE